MRLRPLLTFPNITIDLICCKITIKILKTNIRQYSLKSTFNYFSTNTEKALIFIEATGESLRCLNLNKNPLS